MATNPARRARVHACVRAHVRAHMHACMLCNSVPARLRKGQGAKEIGHNLARERPKFGHNLVRKRPKFGLVGN